MLLLAACSPRPEPTATPSRTPRRISARTAVPTSSGATDTPFPTSTLPPLVTNTPPATETPSLTLTPTEEATATRGPTWTPPEGADGIKGPHFKLYRPVEAGASFGDWSDRTYPYGSTQGGRRSPHHGMEFGYGAPVGAPALASAAGTVVYAGSDAGGQTFGPRANFYGNLVIIRHDFTSNGQPVFTLYGHLEDVAVQQGQRVEAKDPVGTIGGTGAAQGGRHIHFEVRVGNYASYDSTRNPDLWIFPYFDYATLAGRVTDAAGTPLQDVTLMIEPEAPGKTTLYAWSYVGSSVNGDDGLGENFTRGDMEPGYYTVTVREGGRRRFQQTVYAVPDRITWLDVVLD